jgi:ribonuclease HI
MGYAKTGFVIGKSKVAPLQTTTIPRLELCAAVLGTELAQTVCRHLDMNPDSATYYTDSKVVLGYLNNQTRRFYNYVSNRVGVILRRSKPEQWNFVPTSQNPADIGTRCSTSVDELAESNWLRGPRQLPSSQSVRRGYNFLLIDFSVEG